MRRRDAALWCSHPAVNGHVRQVEGYGDRSAPRSGITVLARLDPEECDA